jgi:exopolysaccharide biosynthesis polyprenyl glycosylphosphotransferase
VAVVAFPLASVDAVPAARAPRLRWRDPLLDLNTAVLALWLIEARTGNLAPALLLAPVAWMATLYAHGGYAPTPLGARVGSLRPVLRSGTTLAALGFVASTIVGLPGGSRVWLIAYAALATGALGQRLIWRAARRVRHSTPTRVVAIGPADELHSALVELQRGSRQAFEVVGVHTAGTPDLEALLELVTRTEADAVLVVPPIDPDQLRRMGWQLETTGSSLYLATPLRDTAPARISVALAGRLGVLRVRPTDAPVALLLKELAERAAAVLALLLLTPALLGLAVAVRRDSPGPAIFRQVRVGHGGSFTLYKFRTMRTDAEALRAGLEAANECDGVLFKIRRDPRITRLGAVLRRYSLDELPQLINIVRGEMSLVGPRPALPSEVAQYAPDQYRRLAVKPGLTGLWQVSGRSDLPWEEAVRLDLLYVDNWSLGLDAAILGRTVGAVFKNKGAY